MTISHYNAIVVGAGPGGACAAYELGRAGLRTLLIEKAKLPRHKTCGGGVTFKAAQALPFDISPVVERTISAINFSWRLARPVTLHSPTPLVYMVRRSRFDHYLTEQAVSTGNVTLIDETSLTSVDLSRGGVTVSTTRGQFSADYLVGADGATGAVGRAIGLMSDRQLMPAVECDVEVDAGTADHWRHQLGLDLGSLRASYGWVFPKDDHLNVGVGNFAVMPDTARHLRRYADEHLGARVRRPWRVIKSVGYVLPLRPPNAPIQKGRTVLIGDAAGLVEAFTGEGIYWAVRSGHIAARGIVSHCHRPESELDYERQVDALLMPELIAARRWAHVYMWLPRLCYSLPKRLPLMWRALRAIIRGERGYIDIQRRLGPLGFVADWLPVELN
jgi:geranylgeranyl reductase family protein